MIKGVDVSSYTSVLTNFLYENNIYATGDNDKPLKKYNFYDLEVKKVHNTNQSLMDYINNNLYSYIDQNGTKKHDNMFKILKEQAGVNSLRLRIFVDPKDEKGNYYTSGINSTLESTIWTINQAKKYGIEHFQINFHYSDFFADPSRQFIPKSWSNLNTTQLQQKLTDYTYESLMKIYQETQLFPASVQLGNEITEGLLWNPNNKYSFADGKIIDNAINYVKYAAEGVNKVNKYIDDNNINVDLIDRVLHVESMHVKERRDVLRKYLSDVELNKNIDTIGATYYPFWNSNFDTYYEIYSRFLTSFGKKVIIEEFSVPYHDQSSEWIDDLNMKDFSNRIPATSNAQALMVNTFLNTISKAEPDKEVAFYWWEPSWTNVGNTTWATAEGIKYAVDNDYDKIIQQKDGFTWSNQGLFGESGILLPSAKILKNYQRVNNNQLPIYDYKNQIDSDLKQIVVDDYSVANTYIANNSVINIDQNILYKTNIADELYFDYSKQKTQTINYYYDSTKPTLSIDDVTNLVKSKYTRIMWHQISFENFKTLTDSYQIDIVAKNDSFIYKDKATITINMVDYKSNSLDLTSSELTLNKNDNQWAQKVLQHIKKTTTSKNVELKTEIYKALGIDGDISDHEDLNKINLWLYDNLHGINRYADWMVLKSDKLFKENNIAYIDQINKNQFEYPTSINSNHLINGNILYFGIKKQIKGLVIDKDLNVQYSTYSQVGKESWKNVGTLVFKLNVKLV